MWDQLSALVTDVISIRKDHALFLLPAVSSHSFGALMCNRFRAVCDTE